MRRRKMTVTAERLKALLPGSTEANRLKYLPYFNRYMSQYGIKIEKRAAAFFAQTGTESGQLRYAAEIASGTAYEGRKDLRIRPGDSVKFKGRGLIRITGRYNYEKASVTLGAGFINLSST